MHKRTGIFTNIELVVETLAPRRYDQVLIVIGLHEESFCRSVARPGNPKKVFTITSRYRLREGCLIFARKNIFAIPTHALPLCVPRGGSSLCGDRWPFLVLCPCVVPVFPWLSLWPVGLCSFLLPLSWSCGSVLLPFAEHSVDAGAGVFSTDLACPQQREAGLVLFLCNVEEGHDVESGALEPNRTTDGKYASAVLGTPSIPTLPPSSYWVFGWDTAHHELSLVP